MVHLGQWFHENRYNCKIACFSNWRVAMEIKKHAYHATNSTLTHIQKWIKSNIDIKELCSNLMFHKNKQYSVSHFLPFPSFALLTTAPFPPPYIMAQTDTLQQPFCYESITSLQIYFITRLLTTSKGVMVPAFIPNRSVQDIRHGMQLLWFGTPCDTKYWCQNHLLMSTYMYMEHKML